MIKINNYSVIQFEVKKRLNLTLNEYVLLDAVFYLSQNETRYCYASRNYFADSLDISKQAVMNIIDRLIERGLLEKHHETKHLRCTQLWIDNAYLKIQESLQTVQNYTAGKESLPHGGKESLPDTGKESLPNNNILDNNILDNNNIYASSLESSQQEPTIRKFQTNKNNEYFELKESLYEDYKRLYPNVDLDSELNLIEAWIISNPTRRKTKKGFPKFLNNWLSNSQNKNRSNYATNTRNNKELSDYEKRRQFNFEDVERSLAERRQSSAFSAVFSQPD